jgi:1,2-diacylglycerol 3-beta-glucosyltransferase
MRKAHSAAAAAVGGALALFGARRLLLLAAAAAPARTLPPPGPLPSVAMVVAARDEEAVLPGFLAALDELDYPAELLFTVLVDDGSADRTGTLLAEWSAKRTRATAVSRPSPGGMASALDRGIAAAPPADVVVVCDADLVPDRSCLRELVRPLADPAIGAVAGYRRPVNAAAGPVARYAALEAWTMQLVTSAGKDRLGLDPPTLAFAAFRRRALDEIGGFSPGVRGEDVRLTAALSAGGWRTRFAPDAVADDRVVEELAAYVRQHIRWQGNTLDAGRAAGGPPARRLETLLVAAGYADRPLLLAAAVLLPPQLPAAYLGLRVAESGVALAKAGQGRNALSYLGAAAVLFPLDVAASVAAFACNLRRRSGAWKTQR